MKKFNIVFKSFMKKIKENIKKIIIIAMKYSLQFNDKILENFNFFKALRTVKIQ
jgi:hypothetical protein